MALLVALLAPPPARAAPEATLSIDPGAPLERVNQRLVGLGWHAHMPLAGAAPLRPRTVRIDASLEQVSPAPGRIKLGALRRRVAEVRSVGGEPLVILSYMPAWLGEPAAFGRDPTRVAPADLDAWETLVRKVVRELATARHPARRFEAWNEPDVPVFWQDTQAAWLETVVRTARAVATVERRTGLELEFGGPATVAPDPIWLEPFLARFRDPALPLDFVSWHYYGNYPFLGPDGAESELTEPVHPIVGQQNPVASPRSYGLQIELMRELVRLGLAGSPRPDPPLVLDEWNLSAGGYDHRHDTHVGAAFAAATLIEMQAAGLDAAAFFRADDRLEPGSGDHGIMSADGRRKPVWHTFRLWRRLGPRRVAVAGTEPASGLFALGSTGRGGKRRLRLLVASFSAASPTDRALTIEVVGSRVRAATARRIDAKHRGAGRVERLPVTGGAVRARLPAQSVALLVLKTV